MQPVQPRRVCLHDDLATKRQLQAELGRFLACYNAVRLHRALGCRTPLQAFGARQKDRPRGPRIDTAGYRVRHDKADPGGTVTIRYRAAAAPRGGGAPLSPASGS